MEFSKRLVWILVTSVLARFNEVQDMRSSEILLKSVGGGVVVIEAKKGAIEILSGRSLSYLHLGTRMGLEEGYTGSWSGLAAHCQRTWWGNRPIRKPHPKWEHFSKEEVPSRTPVKSI
jgi:hypothetical protein